MIPGRCTRWTLAAAATIATLSIDESAFAGAVLNQPGSLVSLGVNDLGHLIFDPGSGPVGIAYAGIGDGIVPGCFCEGWGVAANGVSGYANMDRTGAAGARLTLVSFVSTSTSATSTAVLTDLPQLQITQHYQPAPAAPLALFENTITLTNTGATPLLDVRYSRVMDWDIPPNPFHELVTIGGRAGAANVLYSDNNGFEDGDPLGPREPYGQTNVDFTDVGPLDHGAVFDLGFGDLAPGASITFRIFYGATADELSAMSALSAVGAEVFSLGQSEPVGTPATFIWGFRGVGGDPVDPVGKLTVGPGTENCEELYEQTISVAGLSGTSFPSFEFDVVFPSGVIAPSSEVPARKAGPWEVLVELEGADRLHVVVQSPTYPEPSTLPDGEILDLFWEPRVEVPQPPDLPVPVPVAIDPDSVSGVAVPTAVELGFVSLGTPRNPKVHVGSASVFGGGEAIVPVTIEGLCAIDPIFGNYTPHRNYQLEVEFDADGLGEPTATLEGTVVPDWTILEQGTPDFGLFRMDADALIGDFDPEKDLKDGVIVFLRFPTSAAGPFGSFHVRPVSLFVEAAPIVINGDEGRVQVESRPCERPEDVLLSWEDFLDRVQQEEPLTTNRTCTPAHFSRFAFFEDRLAGETKLLMTEPLTFETRGTARDLENVIQPPGADPLCVDNGLLVTGWVSYGDWNPLFGRGSAGERQFLFTSQNFAAGLGRIEPGSEFFRDRDGMLQAFLADKEGEKIFPRRGQAIFVPNYPEPGDPELEFPSSTPAGLIPLTRNSAGLSFWVEDARMAVEYANDPEERAKQGITVDSRGILFSDLDGRRLEYGAQSEKGIYAASCAGKIAATPRVQFKHSAMWGGAHVRGAGEIIVSRGRLCYINDASGHYKPPDTLFQQFLQSNLSTYSFRPLQKFGGFAWTIPRRPTEACQALIGEELGLTLDPWRLTLEADLNRKGRGPVEIENFGDETVRFRVRWPSKASWLSANPSTRSLGPGRSAEIQFVGQCGPDEEVRRTAFWLDDGDGGRISHWIGEVVLDCGQSARN